jgi:hypothetical protein
LVIQQRLNGDINIVFLLFNMKVSHNSFLSLHFFRQSPIHQIPQIQPQVNSPNSFPSFPLDPLVLRAAFNSYFPFQLPNQPNLPTQPHPMASLFPPMNSLSSSQALTALASKKRAAYEEHFSEAKRQRFEDPLDLSSNNADSDDIVDVLSVDPPNHFSRSDPERWNVDQVALFVANIESCQEYAEVSLVLMTHHY